jgi:hypothetical protein
MPQREVGLHALARGDDPGQNHLLLRAMCKITERQLQDFLTKMLGNVEASEETVTPITNFVGLDAETPICF